VRRAGVATVEAIEGWSIRMVAAGDGTPGGVKFELALTSPDGQEMTTVMDVKRKFGMVIKEASDARAESKARIANANAAAQAALTAIPAIADPAVPQPVPQAVPGDVITPVVVAPDAPPPPMTVEPADMAVDAAAGAAPLLVVDAAAEAPGLGAGLGAALGVP
jgi:hypothetical protein